MIKKISTLLLILAIGFVALFSCRKVHKPTGDITLNYFPLHLGNSIIYNVDSIYWNESICDSYNVQCQLMYAITDTFVDSANRFSYIMNVYYRPGEYNPTDGSFWIPLRVIYITPQTETNSSSTVITGPFNTITTGMLVSEAGNQYLKMTFPIANGGSWQGNQFIENNAANQWLQNWTYTYSNYHLSYNNALVNFDNTVTVTEDNESFNYLKVDSTVYSYRTFAEEVYAYNVGMVYKQWTHWTHNTGDNTTCKSGVQVIMQAVSYDIKSR